MTNARCLPKGEAPLCECGCEHPTRWNESKNRWSRFVDGHQNIGRPSALRKEPPPAPLCACGCGQPVRTYRHARGWDKYLRNHAPRQPHTAEAIEKMRQAAQARNITGADCPSWRGGIAPETYRQHPGRNRRRWWTRTRSRIRTRDGNLCVLCHAATKLDMHHIDGDFAHSTDDNLITICHACHMRLEFATDNQSLKEQVLTYMASFSVLP